jgi:hypothetical protein
VGSSGSRPFRGLPLRALAKLLSQFSVQQEALHAAEAIPNIEWPSS